ncbi:MAG: hypothetical protein WB947_08125 [Thermoplasmata archaeon]
MPSNRAIAPTIAGVVLVVVLLASSAGFAGTPSNSSATGAPVHALESPCPGAPLPHNYSGVLEINGVAPVSPLALEYSYDAVVTTNLTDGVVLSSVCSAENGTVTPASGGSFVLSIDAAANVTCTIPGGGKAGECVSTSGPYEALNVTPARTPPPGYVPSVTQNGTNFTVDVYSDLAHVNLHPGGPVATFSPGARDDFRAMPMTGAGTPTPTTPGFSWTLSGVGWTFVGAVDGASVNVTSAPDAAIGNLSVVASLAVPGGTLVTPPSSVELVATTTSISTASLNRTEVDIGQSIGVAVEAVAAAGYDYSATLFPGLGDPAMAVPCTSGPGAGGTASVDCAATFDFDAVGVAQPVVTVTNGVSASTWAFPEVTVHPAPWVAFLPGTPVGYANVTVPITVSAGTETGTAPFERACLEGNGRLTCEGSPGPTWTFNAFYPTPGHYTITAWIVDATGTNRSASTTVSVVSPLEVALVGDPASATAGVPVSLGAVVTGGALPARLWWNTTGSEAPLASGWVTSDGPVGATLVPSSVGFLTISVAVVDGLGTTVTAAETLTVGPGAATLVAPAATPTTSAASAGSSTAIEWVALDAAGIVVPSFSSLAEIELALPGSTATASGWLNASGVGPLASPLPGWFSVPASAWIDGALNVSVTSRTAGPVAVELSLASAVPTADDPVHLEVAPDVDHLRLFDPVTALAGGPANDTLWQVTDRFGNPAYGASVVTTAAFGGSSEETIAPVLAEPDGATEVWVNWSAPGGVAGTVVVTDLAGTELLPPVRVAGPAGPWSAFVPDLLVPIVIGAAAVVGAGLVLRPRRRRSAVLVASVEDAAWLQRLAEGRASVVETVRRHGPVDLAGLASVWEPPPAPPDLADWVASLLTDGTLDARFEDDGVARFFLSRGAAPGVRVTIDVHEFDRGEARREAERVEWDGDDL